MVAKGKTFRARYPVDAGRVRSRVNYALKEQNRFEKREDIGIAKGVLGGLQKPGEIPSHRDVRDALHREGFTHVRKLGEDHSSEGFVSLYNSPSGRLVVVKTVTDPTDKSNKPVNQKRANLIYSGLGLDVTPVVEAGPHQLMPMRPGQTVGSMEAEIQKLLESKDPHLASILFKPGVGDELANYDDGHVFQLLLQMKNQLTGEPAVSVIDRNAAFGDPTGRRMYPHTRVFRGAVDALGDEGVGQSLTEGLQTGLIIAREFPRQLGAPQAKSVLEAIPRTPGSVLDPVGSQLSRNLTEYLSPEEIEFLKSRGITASSVARTHLKFIRAA